MASNTGVFFNINDNDGIPLVGVSTDGRVFLDPFYGNVGVGITNPTSKLHVLGDSLVTGVITASSFVGSLTGTATTASSLTSTASVNTSGIITASSFVGNVTGTATTATTALGVSTTININTSGIITASSFVGNGSGLTNIPSGQLTGALPAIDGSALTGIVGSGSGVIVKDSGTTVGTPGTIDFGDNLTVSAISSGIVTVTGSAPSQWVTTDVGIHTLSNVGIGTTNPTTRISIGGTTGISFADSNIRLGDVDTGSSLIPTGNPNTPFAPGSNNFFAGLGAGKSTTTGFYNAFIGYRAGYANTSGFSNVFIGAFAGNANTGRANTFIGAGAGQKNTTGNFNTFINGAGENNTTGSDNVFLGSSAGRNNNTGSNNVFLGNSAGHNNNTGNENVVIGYEQRDTPVLNGSNQLVIGAGNTAWINGNNSYNVGIGTTNPTSKLHVIGDARVGINTSQGVILTSANGTKYRLIVSDAGVLSTILVP